MTAGDISGIFLSYRRDDDAGHAGRLFDALSMRDLADRARARRHP